MDHSSTHLPAQHLYLTICLYVSFCVLFIAAPSFPADFAANRRIKSPSEELDPFLAASRQRQQQQQGQSERKPTHSKGTYQQRPSGPCPPAQQKRELLASQRRAIATRVNTRSPTIVAAAPEIVLADPRSRTVQGHRVHSDPRSSAPKHSHVDVVSAYSPSLPAVDHPLIHGPLIRPQLCRLRTRSISIRPHLLTFASRPPPPPSSSSFSPFSHPPLRPMEFETARATPSHTPSMVATSSGEHHPTTTTTTTTLATPANLYRSSAGGSVTRNSMNSSPGGGTTGTASRAKRENNRCRIEDWVTPTTLLAHLRLLRCLQSLVIVDDEDLDFLYLIRSEERYLMYLDMLQQHQPAPANVPLPPIDVALMWTVHMLAPFRYHEDLLRNYSPHMLHYAFPLLRYIESIDIEAPTTEDEAFGESKELWRKTYPTEPFDLDKHDTSRMFEIQCLWCGSLNIMDSPTFIKFRIDGMAIDCAGCGSTCSLETLSSKRLWEGVEAYRNDSSQLLAGSLLSLWSGTPDPVTAQREHHHLFYHPRIQFALDQASVSMHCTWPKVIRAFQDLGPDQYYGIRPTTLARVMSSYMGLIEDRLSMDLVAGALRQRDFQKAMMETGGQSWCQAQVLERSLQRYKKYLLLTRAEGKHGLRQGLVPTLDIDLAWHTHMLNPWHYRQFQLSHYGRVLNHDDTVQATSAATRQDFVRTAQLWQDLYQERYSFQPIKKLKKLKNKKKKGGTKNRRRGGGGGGNGDTGNAEDMSEDGITNTTCSSSDDGTTSLTDQHRRRRQQQERQARIVKEAPKWCAGVIFPPLGVYLLLKAAHKGWRRRKREHQERRRLAREEKRPETMGSGAAQQQQQQQLSVGSDEKAAMAAGASEGPRIEGGDRSTFNNGGGAAGVGPSQSPLSPSDPSGEASTSANKAARGATGHGQHGESLGGASTMSKKKLEPNLGLDGRLANWNSEVAGPDGQASCSSGACIMSPWSEMQDIVPYVDHAPNKELRSQRSHS